MKVELENVKPMEIEKRSFEIITEELGDTPLIPGTELIVKRCIHTSADFDYAENLCFSDGAVEKAMEAIRNGACIVTDTQMAKAGINKRALARYGGEAYCFMSDEDVAALAKKNGTTRATACMDKAAEMDEKLIFAIGNAPTALVRRFLSFKIHRYIVKNINFFRIFKSGNLYGTIFIFELIIQSSLKIITDIPCICHLISVGKISSIILDTYTYVSFQKIHWRTVIP